MVGTDVDEELRRTERRKAELKRAMAEYIEEHYPKPGLRAPFTVLFGIALAISAYALRQIINPKVIISDGIVTVSNEAAFKLLGLLWALGWFLFALGAYIFMNRCLEEIGKDREKDELQTALNRFRGQ